MNSLQRTAGASGVAGFIAPALPHVPPAAPEENFLRLLQEGDEAGFALFYDRYAPTIFSLLVRILGDEAEAIALLPEIFLQLRRELPLFDPKRLPLFAWAVMNARKKAITRLRAKSSAQGRGRSQSSGNHLIPRDGQEESPSNLAFFGGLNEAEISARWFAGEDGEGRHRTPPARPAGATRS